MRVTLTLKSQALFSFINILRPLHRLRPTPQGSVVLNFTREMQRCVRARFVQYCISAKTILVGALKKYNTTELAQARQCFSLKRLLIWFLRHSLWLHSPRMRTTDWRYEPRKELDLCW